MIAGVGAGADPATVVTALAAAKAESVCRDLPATVTVDCVVIGCDSMLFLDGELSGKPVTPEETRRRWAAIAGQAGRLFTGHSVARMRDGAVTATAAAAEVTTVRFGVPEAAELRPTSPAGSRSGLLVPSPSTDSAAGSSTASTATRPTWWGWAWPSPVGCWRRWGSRSASFGGRIRCGPR